MTTDLHPQETTPPSAAARTDVGNWARLESARGHSDRPLGAIQGFGKLWQKTTSVRLEGSRATPREVMALWKAHFLEFWAEGGARFRAPLTGIAPGEVADLDFVAPGGLKLSTGIIVLYVDDESFTFMTPEGHVLAGWVTFSAYRDGDLTVAQVQVLMRAQDPIGELMLTFGGHGIENRFWEQTLVNLAARLGVDAVAGTETLCVDPRRQWRRAANIRQNIVIRSTLRAATSPLRWVGSHVGPRIRFPEDADTEGHAFSSAVTVVVAEDDDDTEGHALSHHFPSVQDANDFRRRLMAAGLITATLAVVAAGGVALGTGTGVAGNDETAISGQYDSANMGGTPLAPERSAGHGQYDSANMGGTPLAPERSAGQGQYDSANMGGMPQPNDEE